MNFGVGLALLIVAFALIFIGRPDKDGNSPRFLRVDTALVLYPPVILLFFALGSAALLFSFFK